MTIPDLTQFSDEQLDEISRAIVAEQERRQDLVFIPRQIKVLRARYVERGGDPAALEPGATPEPEAEPDPEPDAAA